MPSPPWLEPIPDLSFYAAESETWRNPMRPKPDRLLWPLATTFVTGMLLTACGSGPSGNDGDGLKGTYMTARIDGQPWQAVEHIEMLIGPAGDTASPGSSPRGLLGLGLNLNSLYFNLA